MNKEQKLEQIEKLINAPTPEWRQCLLRSSVISQEDEFCIHCGEHHPPVLSERQRLQINCMVSSMLAFFEHKLVNTLEWKIDLVGRELYFEIMRMNKLCRLIRRLDVSLTEELLQCKGHLLNLDKRVYPLEEKLPEKKNKYKQYNV